MAKETDLKKQTDRVVGTQKQASRDATRASQAVEGAVRQQTAVMAAGFATTVSELKTHTSLLGSINSTMTAAVGELHGIREDLYATTKNREALEAKSKLERADQMLSSELPADALTLIVEAQALNPADFSVWFAKTHICQKAILDVDGGDFMDEETARSEGTAALERAVKLFPQELQGEPRGLSVAGSLISASLVLGSEDSFLRAVNQYAAGLAAGSTVSMCSPAAEMTRLLDTAKQTPSGDVVAGASADLVARSAGHCEVATLGNVSTEWTTLEGLREGIGAEVAAALASRAHTVADETKTVAAKTLSESQTSWWNSSWPSRKEVQGMVEEVQKAAGGGAKSLRSIRKTLAAAPNAYPGVEAAESRAKTVVDGYEPEAWLKELEELAEPPEFMNKLFVWAAQGWTLLMFIMTSLMFISGDPSTDSMLGALIALAGGVAAYYFFGGREISKAKSAPPEGRTSGLVDKISGVIDGWAR